MKALADWVISAYAEGSGPEAVLARMVLFLQQELVEANEIIEEHEKVAAMRAEANRRLVEVAEELRKQLDLLRSCWADIKPSPRPLFWLRKA